MSTNSLDFLKNKSQWLRKEIFEMVIRVNQGHIASALSQTEILISLFYGGIMRYKNKQPNWDSRDRLIISKGHSAMGIYPILADIEYFDKIELKKYGTPEGILRIYGDKSIPGIDSTSGSLSQAPGIACGFGIACKRDNKDINSFLVLSDGEHYEGSLWESAMFASHNKLDNLIFIVDRNKQIILGKSEECLRLEPLADKWKSFGWNVHNIDGHNYSELLNAMNKGLKKNGHPTVIIANTIKGKGISYMEDVTRWHNTMPNNDQIIQARKDLEINCIK
ncbi:MAG TPA: transketolase [Pelagibacteraceae bacterium]|jgi:transketolase|nr:transketolase [Pelagibacteraceae bacterium]|tara:strand:+ start:724 stop:1557 length:834 start_codon:yes stop_codon:yes gene_type:complete